MVKLRQVNLDNICITQKEYDEYPINNEIKKSMERGYHNANNYDSIVNNIDYYILSPETLIHTRYHDFWCILLNNQYIVLEKNDNSLILMMCTDFSDQDSIRFSGSWARGFLECMIMDWSEYVVDEEYCLK